MPKAAGFMPARARFSVGMDGRRAARPAAPFRIIISGEKPFVKAVRHVRGKNIQIFRPVKFQGKKREKGLDNGANSLYTNRALEASGSGVFASMV